MEVTIYKPSKTEKNEEYKCSTLKQLQHLPNCASNSATYLISGTLHFKAEIEKRTLTIFVRFVRDKNSTL